MNLLCSLVVTWFAHLIGFGREVLALTRLVTMALRWASALHIFPLGLGAPPLKLLPQTGRSVSAVRQPLQLAHSGPIWLP